MTISQLNSQLTDNLKRYIKTSNHSDTGRLYNSIRFNCSDNGELRISFDAYDYIYYLDDGDFLNNFFELSSTLDLIGDYLVTKIEDSID